eukprot:s674_g11.t1
MHDVPEVRPASCAAASARKDMERPDIRCEQRSSMWFVKGKHGVCRSHFSLKPVEKLWRSSKSRSSEETTTALFDNVRTNPRYDRDAITRLPRTLRSRLRPLLDSGCLVLQTPQRARDESLARRGRQHNDNVMIFFEAVLASRMAHWHKGIYLLAAKWERQGTDGSDALVGVNLGGARVSDPRGANELALLQEHLGPTTPFQFLVGGPVGPEKLLALVPFEALVGSPQHLSAKKATIPRLPV